MDENFLTKPKFTKMVEQEVFDKRVSYMEAVIIICEAHNIELDDVRKFIASPIKDKIEAEAMKLNFLPQQNVLPVD